MKPHPSLAVFAAALMVAACGLFAGHAAYAQGGFVGLAPPEAMDTLSGSSVGATGAGMQALDRARDVTGTAPPGQPGFAPPPPGQPGFAPPPSAFDQTLNQAGGALDPLLNEFQARITVIAGTRVFDALTGELLDDAAELQVPESEKANYFDDGTHGDIEPNDGKFTRVDEEHAHLSQGNQRIKEELVQALISANDMNPLEFFGYTIMSTERLDTASSNRAWKIVPNPDGPGGMLVEVPIDKPLKVPRYREEEARKDTRVKDDWADRFLQNYRVNKDSLASDFYPMYIPRPPAPPRVRPPAQWIPFMATVPPEQANQIRTGAPPNAQPMGIDEYAAGGAGHGYYGEQ
jgi:hypothetical protein